MVRILFGTAEMAIEPETLKMPYTLPIPLDLEPGSWVKLEGEIPQQSTGFRVDLASGQFQGANMPLKLELRFDGPASSPAVLTLNSFKEGQLGTEKTLKSSFQQGQPFDLQLVVTSEGYEVMENGTFLADFDHRLPAKTVRFLEIDGDATLKKVDLARG